MTYEDQKAFLKVELENAFKKYHEAELHLTQAVAQFRLAGGTWTTVAEITGKSNHSVAARKWASKIEPYLLSAIRGIGH